MYIFSDERAKHLKLFFFFGITLVTLSQLLFLFLELSPMPLRALSAHYICCLLLLTHYINKKNNILISIISLIFFFLYNLCNCSYYFIQVFLLKIKMILFGPYLLPFFQYFGLRFTLIFASLNSSNIHPHVYIDWTFLEIIKVFLMALSHFQKLLYRHYIY